jgi:hypothetical protein
MGGVALWWLLLVAIGLINILLWVRIRARHGARWPLMVNLSGVYVLGCAIRGFLPKADVERFALFDTWFSSVFFGRSVATVAELAFVAQWSLVLGTLGYRRIARAVFLAIALAECFSWYSVISTHFLGNVIEESLWGISFAAVAACLWLSRRWLLAIACSAYVGFMAWVDVPMYWNRLRAQLVEGANDRGFWEGIYDLNTRRVVTWEFEHWRPEMPWMTLYFSLAVWMSLWLCGWPRPRSIEPG